MIKFKDVNEKIRHYCAYQERCMGDVRNKLRECGVVREEREQMLKQLIDEGYVDEERFVRSFVRGKINIKHWGIHKIRLDLRRRSVSETLINAAIGEIDNETFLANLDKLASKWLDGHKPLEKHKLRRKIYDYLYSMGYDREDILNYINKIIK